MKPSSLYYTTVFLFSILICVDSFTDKIRQSFSQGRFKRDGRVASQQAHPKPSASRGVDGKPSEELPPTSSSLGHRMKTRPISQQREETNLLDVNSGPPPQTNDAEGVVLYETIDDSDDWVPHSNPVPHPILNVLYDDHEAGNNQVTNEPRIEKTSAIPTLQELSHQIPNIQSNNTGLDPNRTNLITKDGGYGAGSRLTIPKVTDELPVDIKGIEPLPKTMELNSSLIPNIESPRSNETIQFESPAEGNFSDSQTSEQRNEPVTQTPELGGSPPLLGQGLVEPPANISISEESKPPTQIHKSSGDSSDSASTESPIVSEPISVTPPTTSKIEPISEISPANLENSQLSHEFTMDPEVNESKPATEGLETVPATTESLSSVTLINQAVTTTDPINTVVPENVENIPDERQPLEFKLPSTFESDTDMDEIEESNYNLPSFDWLLNLEIIIHSLFAIVLVSLGIFLKRSLMDSDLDVKLEAPDSKVSQKEIAQMQTSLDSHMRRLNLSKKLSLEEQTRSIMAENKELEGLLKLAPLKKMVADMKEKNFESHLVQSKTVLERLKSVQSLIKTNLDLKEKIKLTRYDILLMIRNFIEIPNLLDLMKYMEFNQISESFKDSTFNMNVEIDFLNEQIETYRRLTKSFMNDYDKITKEISKERGIESNGVKELADLRNLCNQLDLNASIDDWKRKVAEKQIETDKYYKDYINNYYMYMHETASVEVS